MKFIALIIILLSLLQPILCFAHPCESCFVNADVADKLGSSSDHAHNHDEDNCDSSVCCAVFDTQPQGVVLPYKPLISKITGVERYKKLPSVVIPIFVPPQRTA